MVSLIRRRLLAVLPALTPADRWANILAEGGVPMRIRKIVLAIVLAVASALLLVPSSVQALECVGVPGVAQYCPGRHCIRHPCY